MQMRFNKTISFLFIYKISLIIKKVNNVSRQKKPYIIKLLSIRVKFYYTNKLK